MAQRPKHSLLEVCLGTASGFAIGVMAQVVVFPWFGLHVPVTTNIAIAVPMTLVSVARSYVFRRIFNKFTGD